MKLENNLSMHLIHTTGYQANCIRPIMGTFQAFVLSVIRTDLNIYLLELWGELYETMYLKGLAWGLLWWASGSEFTFQSGGEAWVWSLVGEPRPHTRGCVHAEFLQSCLTLCNPVDYSPPRSSLHGFSRQDYWSGLPCPSPRNLPHPGIELTSPAAPVLQADSLPLGHQGSPRSHVPRSN